MDEFSKIAYKRRREVIISDLNGDSNVSEAYRLLYPIDIYTHDHMDKQITFADVFDCVKSGNNLSELLKVSDSIVRERLFVLLVRVFHISLGNLYRIWYKSGRR